MKPQARGGGGGVRGVEGGVRIEVFSGEWRHSAAQAPAHSCSKCQGAHPAGGQETLPRSACLTQLLSVSTPGVWALHRGPWEVRCEEKPLTHGK